MEWSRREQRILFILFIGFGIGGGIALIVASQSFFPDPVEPLEFRTVESVCGTAEEARANISVDRVDDRFQRATVTGVMVGPNPCTRINASLIEPQNNTYRLSLQLLQNDTACSQCVGNLRYRATLNLPTTTETVAVTHNGQVMTSHQFRSPERTTQQLPQSAP